MLYNSLTVLIISLTVLVCLVIFSILIKVFAGIYSILFSWFESRKADREDGEEEFDDYFIGKYDVNAFRERVKGMVDEDGLYDIIETYKPTPESFTGVEVVTESREADIDRLAERSD